MKHTVPLKENHIFRRLYQKGKRSVSPYFAVYCRPNGRAVTRLGLTTGVKLGNAVTRNRVRRRMREIYRTHEEEFLPGYDLVIVARTQAVRAPYGEMEDSFRRSMRRLGLTAPREGGAC